ncbi:MAG: hypothetical protein ACHQNT_12395, partial [Bacteroidia bacterium]
MKQILLNNQRKPFLRIARITFSIFLLLLVCNKTKASDYYWVGGTGNWSDYANHWATTSGGLIFHIQVPSAFDNVYFDANSFSASGQSLTVDSTNIFCNDMNWTGVLFNPSLAFSGNSSNIKIYGSLTLASNMTFGTANNYGY